YGNRVAYGSEHAQPGRLGKRLLATAFLLLDFEGSVGACVLLLPFRMMDQTLGIGANAFGLALFRAFRDDRLGRMLARLVFRPVALLFALRLVLPNFDVLVSRNHCAAILGLSICCADLYQLRLGGNGLLHMRVQLRLEAFRVTARIGLTGPEIGEEQNIVSCALWAINAGTCFWQKL